MIRVCHLLDGGFGWEQRIAVSQLTERLPRDQSVSAVATLNFQTRLNDVGLRRIPVVSILTLSRFLAGRKIDLVHAWGVGAFIAARTTTRLPIVLELFDPVLAARHGRLLRTIARPRGFAIACSSAIVRRRLIERGISPESAVVIRPGVDFARITRVRRGTLRASFGVGPDEYLITVPPPTRREDGAEDAYWAAALLNHLYGGIRIAVPGCSREQQRVMRLAVTLTEPLTLVHPPHGARIEELIAISDAHVVAAREDTPTTSMAWAMAARSAVIGSATYAVTELITNKVNGLLFRQFPGKSMASAIARCLQDRETQKRLKEAASGQAYEVFGVRRFVDQHLRFYRNILRGVAPGEGIVDTAMTG